MDKESQFKQFIQYKALNFKFSIGSGCPEHVEHLMNLPGNAESLGLKNVCAKLDGSLVARLDETISVLGISKREFIEYAITEALDVSDKIIQDVDMMEFMESSTIPAEQKLIEDSKR